MAAKEEIATITVEVQGQRQYAVPGRAAMFAWKPLYTVRLPLPRTDGLFVQSSNSKAELKQFVQRHLRSQAYPVKVILTFPVIR